MNKQSPLSGIQEGTGRWVTCALMGKKFSGRDGKESPDGLWTEEDNQWKAWCPQNESRWYLSTTLKYLQHAGAEAGMEMGP